MAGLEREKGQRERVERFALLALVCGICLFSFFFLSVSLFRFHRLTAYAYDLGIFMQGVWLMAQGETPFVTLRGLHLFADHFSPILLLFVPLYRLYPHPFWFFLFQSFSFGLCALPLYRLSLRWLPSPSFALFFSLSSLLHPVFFSMLFFDFHPLVLSLPFLLWAVLAIEEGRTGQFFAAIPLALSCREDVVLPVLCISLWGMFRGRRWCLFALLLAALWFWLATTVMKELSGIKEVFYLALYERWGKTPSEILTNILSHPFTAAKEMVMAKGITIPPGFYLVLLLAPFGFVPIIGFEFLIFGLPCFAFVTLGDRPAMRDLGFQHGALVIFWVMIANLRGWSRIVRWMEGLPERERMWWKIALLALWILCLLCFAVRYGKSSFSVFTRDKLEKEEAKIVWQLLREKIPEEASVSATTTFAVPLAHRREIYLFPNPFIRCLWGASREALMQMDGKEKVKIKGERELMERIKERPVLFVVVKRRTNWWPMERYDYDRLLDIFLAEPYYEIIANFKDFYILRAKGR
jgi:uncharacterized membrane protein